MKNDVKALSVLIQKRKYNINSLYLKIMKEKTQDYHTISIFYMFLCGNIS